MDAPPAEVEIDAALVARLVAAQHPSFAGPVTWLSGGWDNELFRLGDDYVVRMPRRAIAVELIENEQRWLPALQELVEVPLPVPVAVGLPSGDYAWPWSIARWIPGEPVAHVPVSARDGIVDPLADFVRQLHVPAAPDAPINHVRGTPLAARDAPVRERLGSGAVPHPAELLEIWERALAAPVYGGPPIWMHGDLHPLNALVSPTGSPAGAGPDAGGRVGGARVAGGGLAAVLDFGDLGGADPACDLAAAWLFFDETQRLRFRTRIGTAAPHDRDTWTRALGWAVAEVSAFLMNSEDAPVLDAIGHHGVAQLLTEL